jgi:hypothetical protein
MKMLNGVVPTGAAASRRWEPHWGSALPRQSGNASRPLRLRLLKGDGWEQVELGESEVAEFHAISYLDQEGPSTDER